MADDYRPAWMYCRRPDVTSAGSPWITSLDPDFHDERIAVLYGQPHPIAAGQPVNAGDVEHPGALLVARPAVLLWAWTPYTALTFRTQDDTTHSPAGDNWSPTGVDQLDLVLLRALLGLARRKVRAELRRRKAAGDGAN